MPHERIVPIDWLEVAGAAAGSVVLFYGFLALCAEKIGLALVLGVIGFIAIGSMVARAALLQEH